VGSSILLVEDDPSLREIIATALTARGYEVDVAGDGRTALERAAIKEPDLVILDLGLPDIDGVEVCRELRRWLFSPILVLSADGDNERKVAALDEGADDYLVKPFGLAELLARIRAVLRRVRPVDSAGQELLRHGLLMVDPRTHKVTVGEREVALTPKEFDILEALAVDPGRVVTRQEILERAWDAHWYGPTKVLDVHVAALRRKLGVPGLVETVYGRGFRLGTPDTAPETPTEPPAPPVSR
jgi:DNA-binding response OmpR family regulator